MSLLFSIVIPTYNRADLILETVESVLQQSYKNYEIIIVDNHSTDNTEQVLTPLIKAEKVKYFKHDKNYERSKSRNTGMEQATGDFLTFLDSDDFMYVDCLKDAVEFIERNPTIKSFHNLYELVDNKRNRLYSYRFPSLVNQYKALASGNFISCIGGLISREIYQKQRFNEDPKMIGSEDYEVWFEILAKYNLGRINKVNSGIREHPNRSVNLGVYHNLNYQKNAVLAKLENDPLLFEKFGLYLSRLRASFLLQEAIVLRKLDGRLSGTKKTVKALSSDKTILFSRRFYAVIYNILK